MEWKAFATATPGQIFFQCQIWPTGCGLKAHAIENRNKVKNYLDSLETGKCKQNKLQQGYIKSFAFE